MKQGKRIITSFLVFTLLGCDTATAVETKAVQTETETETVWEYDDSATLTAEKKEEMVNVEAKPDGSVKEITVNTVLSGIEGSNVIRDESDLTDIKNAEGDEQFTYKDGVIYWENLGEDTLSYSGTSTKDLPVSLRVTYYLNDREVNADQIAGKSGEVKIRFDYDNTTVNDGVHVPFMCISLLMLSDDHFSNVEVNNGSVSNSEGTYIVMGYAVPKLKDDLNLAGYEDLDEIDIPEYVEVSATADDFELDFTETIISTGLFEEIEESDLKEFKDLGNDMKDLGKASNELADASNSLSDGFTELQDGINTYLDGMNTVSEAIGSLKDGTSSLDEGAGQLNDGLKTLYDTLAAVDLSAYTASDSSTNTLAQLKTLVDTLNGMITLKSMPTEDGTTVTYYVMEALDQAYLTSLDTLDTDGNTLLTDDQKNALLNAFQGSEIYQTYAYAIATSAQSISAILTSLNSMQDMIGQMAKLQEAVKTLSDGMASLKAGTSALSSGVSELDNGMKEAVNNNQTIKDGMNSYKDGLKEYTDAVKKLNTEALQELSNSLGKDTLELVSKVEKIKAAEESYNTFTKLSEGQEGSVTFLIETDKIGE